MCRQGGRGETLTRTSRRVAAHGPAFSVYPRRGRLALGLFGTPQPAFGHAVPRGPILEIDRRACHRAALVGVSAEFLCGVHGVRSVTSNKEQTPDRVSGSRHYVANLMSRPPQAIFEGWSPRHALTGALGSPGAVPCPFSNCRTVLTGFDDPKVRAHFGEMIAEAVLRSGRGIAVRRGNQDIVEFR
jgi:hypothetical protein